MPPCARAQATPGPWPWLVGPSGCPAGERQAFQGWREPGLASGGLSFGVGLPGSGKWGRTGRSIPEPPGGSGGPSCTNCEALRAPQDRGQWQQEPSLSPCVDWVVVSAGPLCPAPLPSCPGLRPPPGCRNRPPPVLHWREDPCRWRCLASGGGPTVLLRGAQRCDLSFPCRRSVPCAGTSSQPRSSSTCGTSDDWRAEQPRSRPTPGESLVPS